MIVKICKKHGELTESEICKEKSKYAKMGYRLRCLQCRRDKDRTYKLNNPDKHKASASRARNESRRLYREGLTNVVPKANMWAKKDRLKNHDIYLEKEKKRRIKEGQLRNTKEVCRRFNTTVDEYYRMLNEQNNKCKICNNEETRKSRTDGKICALAIDHCHQTGKIRDLLCHDCNTGLGKFKDSVNILKSAIVYLEKHNHI